MIEKSKMPTMELHAFHALPDLMKQPYGGRYYD